MLLVALDLLSVALGLLSISSRFSITSEILFEVPELLLRVLHSNALDLLSVALGCSRLLSICSRFALDLLSVSMKLN